MSWLVKTIEPCPCLPVPYRGRTGQFGQWRLVLAMVGGQARPIGIFRWAMSRSPSILLPANFSIMLVNSFLADFINLDLEAFFFSQRRRGGCAWPSCNSTSGLDQARRTSGRPWRAKVKFRPLLRVEQVFVDNLLLQGDGSGGAGVPAALAVGTT